MSIHKRHWLLIVLLLVPSVALAADSTTTEVERIVRRIDQLYRSKTSYAAMEMEIITPNWQRTLAMDIWTEGMEKTFIRITAPKKEEGTATLRLGNEMWNYLPKINKVLKVPPSMMMSSWMGSDFTNDDLVKEYSLLKDYSYDFTNVDSARDDEFYINCIPRKDLPVVWASIVVAVRKIDSLPVWMKYYDEKGALMREWNYSDVREFDGRKIPATLIIVPQHKEGQRTILRYQKVKFDPALPGNTFSLDNLHAQH